MNLLRSRKFLLMLLDVVLSIILHFVGRYYPAAVGDVNFLIATLQPVFIAVIGGIAWEDAAQKKWLGEKGSGEEATTFQRGG